MRPYTKPLKLPQQPRPRDPWIGTVATLLGRPQASQPCDAVAVPAGRPGYADGRRGECAAHPETSISVLARLTDCTVTIAWTDATRGSYRDQMWRRIRARGAGVCSISGAPIARGDLVYRPRPSQPPTANADAMILAAVIDAVALQPE